MGSAPNDVKTSPEMQYEIERKHGEQIKHNNDKWRAKAGRLRDAGAMRLPLARDTWERIDAPKFSGEVKSVDGFKEVMSSLVIRATPSKHPLQCLLEALILILASKRGPVVEGGPDRGKCYRILHGT